MEKKKQQHISLTEDKEITQKNAQTMLYQNKLSKRKHKRHHRKFFSLSSDFALCKTMTKIHKLIVKKKREASFFSTFQNVMQNVKYVAPENKVTENKN